MADEATPRPVTRKEPEVLTDASLMILARGLGILDLKGLELAMYLNVPTTTIVSCISEVTETALTAEGSEDNRVAVTSKCLMFWKETTKEAKNRDKIKVLEKAIREIGKSEIADTFMERHQNNQELSSDIFA